MKMGHEFHAMHGFSGSAGKDMRPKIPGYAKGGEVTTVKESSHKHDTHPKMKHGGKVKKGHK